LQVVFIAPQSYIQQTLWYGFSVIWQLSKIAQLWRKITNPKQF